MAYKLSTLPLYNVNIDDNSNSAAVKCHSGYERIKSQSDCEDAHFLGRQEGEVNNESLIIQDTPNEPPGCWYYPPLKRLFFNKNKEERTSSYSHGGDAHGARNKRQLCIRMNYEAVPWFIYDNTGYTLNNTTGEVGCGLPGREEGEEHCAYSDKTLYNCENLCNANPICRGFSWKEDENNHRLGKCWLKGDNPNAPHELVNPFAYGRPYFATGSSTIVTYIKPSSDITNTVRREEVDVQTVEEASHISDSAGAGNTNLASPVPGASSLEEESSSTSTSTSGGLPSQPTNGPGEEYTRECFVRLSYDYGCSGDENGIKIFGEGRNHNHVDRINLQNHSPLSNADYTWREDGRGGYQLLGAHNTADVTRRAVENRESYRIEGKCGIVKFKNSDNRWFTAPAPSPHCRNFNSNFQDDVVAVKIQLEDCDNGWYLADNFSKCRSCLDGQVAGPGATECITCPAGKSPNAERTECVDCDDGYFSQDAGSTSCTRCEAGHISNSTKTGCVQCEAGKYSNSQRTTCLDCSVGQYSNAGSTNCVRCESGEYAPAGSAECSTCAAGKHSMSPNPGGSCIDCAAGKYSEEERASRCISCGPGKYSTAVGSSNEVDCDNCPVGQRAISNHTSCGDCPNPIANASFTCNDAGVSTISACNEGYRPVAGRCVINHCLCENGTGVITNETDQQVCLNHNDSDNPQCRECDPGYHLVGNECIQNVCRCEDPSSGRDFGVAKGQPIPSNWPGLSDAEKNTETICLDNGITDCHICKPGYHLSDHTPEGVGGRTTKECVPNDCTCFDGVHATGALEINGSTACPDTGTQHCVSCNDGYRFCPELDENGSCSTEITATSGGSSVTYGTECRPYRCGADEKVLNNECVPCPDGKVKNVRAASADEGEILGDLANGGDTTCDTDNCPVGTYLSQHHCLECPAGKTSPGGEDRSLDDNTMSNCTDIICEENTKVTTSLCIENCTLADNVCTPCEPGTINPAGDNANGQDTTCNPIICGIDERVQDHACVSCCEGGNESCGKNNSTGGHDASGADTECDDIICGVGERVLANECVDCPDGSQNLEGGHNAGTNSETNCNHACNETVICEDPSKLIDPTIYCEGVCALTDEDLCCTLTKALCSTYTDDCPTGKSLNDTNYCSGIECSETDDVDLCCIQNATCGTLTESCPSGKIIDENVNCSSLTCGTSDLETCCITDTTSSTGTGTSVTNIQKINSTATYSEANITDIAEGSTERANFEERFIQAIRDNLGIPDLVVVINGISEGSVIVDFSIEVNNMTNEEAIVESQKLTDNPTGLDLMIGETQQTAQLSEITVVEEEISTGTAAASDIDGNIIKEVNLPIDGSLVKIAYSDSNGDIFLADGYTSVADGDLVRLQASNETMVIEIIKKYGCNIDAGSCSLAPNDQWFDLSNGSNIRPSGPDTINGLGQELYAHAICPIESTDCNQDCIVVWSECTEKCEKKEERISTILVDANGTGKGCSLEAVDCKKNHGKCDSSSDGGFIAYAIGFVVIFAILALFIYLMSSGGGSNQPSLPPRLVPPQPTALAAPAPAVR